jgi:uncharacterized repeat protein (TIGR01451 family)
MRQMLLLVVVLFCTALSLRAQCPSTDLVFTNQQQVDSFALLYPNCTVIPRSVKIRDFAGNIQGLNQITKIRGSLSIFYNFNMITMGALSQLSFVEGNVEISSNNILTSLPGLNKLSRIGGGLNLYYNQNLTHLNDFQALTDLDSTLRIETNQKLTNVSGLNQLQYIGGSLQVSDNQALRYLNGFDQVAFVGQNVSVTSSFNGGYLPDSLQILPTAISIGGSLNISSVVKQIKGFHALEEVAGSISYSCTGAVDGFRLLRKVGSHMNCRQASSLVIFNKVEEITGALDINAPASATEPVFTSLRYLYGGLSVYNYNNKKMWLQGFSQLLTSGRMNFTGDSLVMIPEFENLTTLNGEFSITNCKITEYKGLNQLKSMVGAINISNCSALKKLDMCATLEEMTGGFAIASAALLDTIVGFDLLKKADGLDFSSLGNLRKLADFQNLEFVAKSINFASLALTEFPKFGALKHVGIDLSISSLRSLKVMNSFPILDSVSNRLTINGLDSLETFEGFNSLLKLNSITIYSNDRLKSIGDFPSLSNVKNITVTYNQMLSDCNAYFLCQFLVTSPTFSNLNIYGNAQGCNSKIEVESSCTGQFPILKGRVYLDMDCNDQLSTGDIPLKNKIVRKTSGAPYTLTDSTGYYQALLPFGTTQLTADTISFLGYLLKPYSYSVTPVSAADSFLQRDFRYCPVGPFANLCTSISASGAPRPGFTHTYTIEVLNIGSVPTDGLVHFSIQDSDPRIKIESATLGATFTTKDAVLEIIQLKPFDKITLTVTVKLQPSVELGKVFSVSANAEVLDIQDIQPFNNAAGLRLVVVGSYDPNDKTVNLDEFDIDAVAGKKLDLVYQIRFQNTGTFPAEFVVVKDTLPTWLDIRTFSMLQASHAYTMDFSDPRVLHWRFDSIQLADSASNEPESHGYILFKIRTQGNFTLLDTIKNRCGIYFDFNTPVITNYSTVSFFERVGTEAAPNSMQVQLSPNPARQQLQVQFEAETTGTYYFTVLAPDGSVQLRQEAQIGQTGAQNVPIDLTQLNTGVKILQILSPQGVYSQAFMRM